LTPIEISLIVFASVFAGALFGMYLRALIPKHHLQENTENVIKLGMGLIATMAALVLGLLIATAKNSYETQDDAVKHTAAKILLLDHMLSNYGPETREARELLRRTVAARLERSGRKIAPNGRGSISLRVRSQRKRSKRSC